MEKSADKKTGRRDFMKAAIIGIGGLIGAALTPEELMLIIDWINAGALEK